MLDRSIPPLYKSIEYISYPTLEQTTLSTGTQLYGLRNKSLEVFKIDFIFNGGKSENAKLVTGFFNSGFLSGTSSTNSTETEQLFSRYGGFVETDVSIYTTRISLYGLSIHFEKYIAAFSRVMLESIYPENEFETIRKILTTTWEQNQEKPSYVANTTFKNKFFGSDHIIGKIQLKEEIISFSKDHVRNFHLGLTSKALKIFLSGKFPKNAASLLEKSLPWMSASENLTTTLPFKQKSTESIQIEKEGSMQSTIRYGCQAVGRKDQDFFKLNLANTLFGGYFGSRLMKNIREDKGFTYGIYSSFSTDPNGGYLVIASDVIKENTEAVFQEIHKEISTIKEKTVDSEELLTVKNYIKGKLANVSNCFEVVQMYQNLALEGLPSDFYTTYLESLDKTTPDDILQMAQKYYRTENFLKVVVC